MVRLYVGIVTMLIVLLAFAVLEGAHAGEMV
jgi:hypothetical protein